jgi:UDP-N-acetylmuramoylalanine--D-glutamate ligase
MTTLLLGSQGKTGKSVEKFIKNLATFDDSYSHDIDWENISQVIQSPGFPFNHPVALEARSRHIPIRTDIDLFFESRPHASVIGITGTNGKSTTTAWVTYVLQKHGFHAVMGGNIGIPVLDLPESEVYVFELSSYQLALSGDLPLMIACILNISSDHLDWHGSIEHYKASKMKILKCAEHCLDSKSTIDLPQSSYLKGMHNHQNMSAVYNICSLFCKKRGVEFQMEHLLSFKGLEHRQEYVDHFSGITFINDSKATNQDATQHALAAFDDIYWIAGGRPKEDGISDLDFSHIKSAYYIGEAAQAFNSIHNGRLSFTLEKALHDAYHDALKQGGGVILLSPACASWDQFKNFEERGNVFKRLVLELKKNHVSNFANG